METDLLTVQQSAEILRIAKNPSPLSDEELKDFYLKFARIINPSACSSNRNDFEVLNILYKDLKRNLGMLCKYTQHAWDEGIPEIQTVCGVYLVQDSIQRKERLQINTSLGKHLQFLAQMASGSSVARKIHAEYTRHSINVDYLLKQMANDKEPD
ncbi:MAG: hypothetical protein LUD46_23235 [Parabacteroides sp.]|nr:hypothetical protein [Parabacteroides sp.]